MVWTWAPRDALRPSTYASGPQSFVAQSRRSDLAAWYLAVHRLVPAEIQLVATARAVSPVPLHLNLSCLCGREGAGVRVVIPGGEDALSSVLA